MAVIHSASLKGVGIANAGVIWCSEGSGNFEDASPKCVEDPTTIDAAVTLPVLTLLQGSGDIDNLGNVVNLPIYLIHTTNDVVVSPNAAVKQ